MQLLRINALVLRWYSFKANVKNPIRKPIYFYNGITETVFNKKTEEYGIMTILITDLSDDFKY